MKFLISALLILLCIITISCEKKKSSSGVNSGTRYPAGVTAGSIYGYATINSSCGTNTATVQLYSINSNQVLFSLQVTNGGTYQFQTTAGSYTLVATAGNNCYVSGPVQSSSTRAMGYDLNIANYGSNYNNNNSNCTISTGCNNYWGKTGVQTSNANIYLNSSIYLSGVENEKTNLKMNLKDPNSLVASTPIHSLTGWNGLVKDNKFNINEFVASNTQKNVSYDSLYYDIQIDDTLLQSEFGECLESTKVIESLKKQMEEVGFRTSVINDMVASTNKKLPKLTEIVCIYPQVKDQIEKIAEVDTNKSYSAKRIWFILVPQVELQAKFSKPKKAAIALLKNQNANRTIAQSQLSVEEWGVGFFIEKN